MKKFATVIFSLISFTLGMSTHPATAQPSLQGYVRYFPLLSMDRRDFSFSPVNHTIHNRINFSYSHCFIRVYAGQRTRLFSGPNASNPFFKAFLENDLNGPIDMSFVLHQRGDFLAHTITDRFYLDFMGDTWQLSIGRQRINWGINLATNPQDLFNNYSFFDFDYPERPGADAIRVQRFLSPTSRIEVAAAPGRKRSAATPGRWEVQNSVLAALWAFNSNGYDVQLTAGYFRHRWHGGIGWAGHLWNAGFKGEISYFHDIEPLQGVRPGNITATISADYSFENGVFLTLETTFNQRRSSGGGLNPLTALIPRSADDVAFSQWQVLAVATYPISPVQSFTLSGIWLPEEKLLFAGPSYVYSVWKNVDINCLAQLFFAPKDNPINAAGYTLALLATWSF
jgi:hypothetical protein